MKLDISNMVLRLTTMRNSICVIDYPQMWCVYDPEFAPFVDNLSHDLLKFW